MRLGVGGKVGPFRAGVSARSGGSDSDYFWGCLFSGAVVLLVLFGIGFWPWLLGEWVWVHVFHQLGRTITNPLAYAFEIIYIVALVRLWRKLKRRK